MVWVLLLMSLTGTVLVPSEYSRSQGGVPVRAMVRSVVSPAQRVAVPERVAVGISLTVMTAVPEAVPVQLASLTAVNV